MKRIISAFTVLLLCICLCGCEEKEKYPNATSEFYVNDFANVMTDDEESRFLSKSVALNQATTAQVVVATVNSMSGDSIEEYSTELGRKWGIGDKEQKNGVLILLSLEEREIFVSVGYGLEGALPDSKTGRIIDVYGLDYLKNDRFGKGILAIGEAVINEVYIEYGLSPEEGYVNIENITAKQDVESGSVLSSWAIMLIVLVLLSFLTRRRGGSLFFFGFPHSGFGGHSGGNFRSGGGGFGGFSGGGGSFGGGGAGRGF